MKLDLRWVIQEHRSSGLYDMAEMYVNDWWHKKLLNYFRLISWLQKFLLLLISPLVLLYIAAILSSLGEKHGNYYQLLINSWNALSRGLFLSMMDRYFFGSWMFSLFSFAVLPNWLTLWGISFCEPVWWKFIITKLVLFVFNFCNFVYI